jgi:Ricin-type beta-trefoil lectin domain
MMRGIRRLVAYTAVAGLLVTGMVSASLEAAHADTPLTVCNGAPGDSFNCTLDGTVSAVGTITVSVNSGATNEEVNVGWTVTCTDSTGVPQSQEGATDNAETPLTVPLVPLPATADGSCSVNAQVTLPKPDITPKTDFSGTLSYTPAGATPTSPSTTGPPVRPVKGIDGKCLDDKGNSSANRTKIIVWTCNGTDQAQSWKYSGNEFIHNGKCMNDQGNGGIRSKVILYSCNGASNEKWIELANGELKLKSHGGTLCLDDPRSSTTNGTQLILYTCTDAANQKWSLP